MSFASPTKSQGSTNGRKPYEEQNLIPVTVKMLMNSQDQPGEVHVLPDGREITTIKLIGAIRTVSEDSTNMTFEIEDGTGLIEVKQYVDEGVDNKYVREMRTQTSKEHIYVKIFGKINSYGGKKKLTAFSVRSLTSENELTHHFLEVAYSYSKYQQTMNGGGSSGKSNDAFNSNGLYGMNNSMASGGAPPPGVNSFNNNMNNSFNNNNNNGGELIEQVKQFIMQEGSKYCVRVLFSPEKSIRHTCSHLFYTPPPLMCNNNKISGRDDVGVHINEVLQNFMNQGHSDSEIRTCVHQLTDDGGVFTTIDTDYLKGME